MVSPALCIGVICECFHIAGNSHEAKDMLDKSARGNKNMSLAHLINLDLIHQDLQHCSGSAA